MIKILFVVVVVAIVAAVSYGVALVARRVLTAIQNRDPEHRILSTLAQKYRRLDDLGNQREVLEENDPICELIDGAIDNQNRDIEELHRQLANLRAKRYLEE